MPERVDDPTIADSERLWRRVAPSQIHQPPGVVDPPAPPSFAFKSNAVPISVNLASLSTQQDTLAGYPDFSLLEVTAGEVRSAGCTVIRSPEPDNPAHALILGNGPNGRLKKAEARKIANAARWISFEPP